MKEQKYYFGENQQWAGEYELTLLTMEATCVDGIADNGFLSAALVHLPTHTKVSGETMPPDFVQVLARLNVSLYQPLDVFDLRNLNKEQRESVWSHLDQRLSLGETWIVHGNGQRQVIWQESFEYYRAESLSQWEPVYMGIVARPFIADDFVPADTWVIGVTMGDVRRMLEGHKTCDVFLRAMCLGGSLARVALPLQTGVFSCVCSEQEEHEDFVDSGLAAGLFSHDLDGDAFFEQLDYGERCAVENIVVEYRLDSVRLVGNTANGRKYIESENLLPLLRSIQAGS